MTDDIRDVIRKASRSVAYQWPGIVEAEDLQQEIAMRLLESPGSLEHVRELEEGAQFKTLRNMGHQIANRERTDYEYFSGNFRYAVNEVKSLLSSGMLQELGTELKSSWSAEEYITKGSGFEDSVLAKNSMETDLRRGLRALAAVNSRYYEIVHRRYLRDDPLGDDERSTLSRALTKLTDLMNRSFKRQHADRTDGPGTRSATSNATAYVQTAQQYIGSDRSWGR